MRSGRREFRPHRRGAGGSTRRITTSLPANGTSSGASEMCARRFTRYHFDMLNASRLVGTHDVLFVTLDTLRYDVAANLHAAGRTPNLSAHLPHGWEKRHTPGSFTFAAHAAFFAGFLPTPATPGKHPRL